MILAEEMFATAIEEPAVAVIKSDGQMSADVLIRHECPAKPRHKTFAPNAITGEFKFLSLALRQGGRAGDSKATHSWSMGHTTPSGEILCGTALGLMVHSRCFSSHTH
jgi:hypothetical protein